MKYLALIILLPINLFGQPAPHLELSKIADSVWVYTSHKFVNSSSIPANGLIIQTTVGLILIDTPWDDSLTTALLDTARKQFQQSVVLAIVTHAHEDRIGGIAALHKKLIKTVSTALTCRKAKDLGYEVPEQISSTDTLFVIGNEQVELFYPGAGHTVDNSVVWFPDKKILFGGCIVKSESSANLGNIADADLKEWPRSIHNVMDKFSGAQIVIPGHGAWGGMELLRHTLDLLSAKQASADK